jgi:hypothetical protein
MKQLTSALHSLRENSKKYGQLITESFGQRANRLLLIESRGFGINAYLVERSGDAIELVHFVCNTHAEPGSSLTDICAQLKNDGYPWPKKALLISGATTTALLPLPIENDKKLSDKQMLELVRWEMEPLFTEHIAHWSIGGLLIACGYLTEPQRKQLLVELGEQKERLAGRGGRAPTRFGELAIQAGFISQAQLDECLILHEKNQMIDPAIDCSWSDQSISSTNQGGLWLCSAMSLPIRQQWLTAFAQQKIFLAGIYSQHHSAVSQLPVAINAQLLLVINVSLVTVIQVKDNQVISTKQHRCSDYALTTDDIIVLLSEFIEKGLQQIYYSGHHANINNFISELVSQTQCEMICLDNVLDLAHRVTKPFSGDAAMMGAARHYFYKFSSLQNSVIPGTPPPPPWYKEPAAQLAMILFALSVALGINELHYWYTEKKTLAEVQQNQLAVEKIEAINTKLNSKNTEYNELKAKKEQRKEELMLLANRKQGLNSVLLKRQEFVAQLLPLISRSINELIILNQVNENTWYHFEIIGWASDQLAIDKFNQELTEQLEQWGMQITNNSSQAEDNYGTRGYQFTMSLAPVDAS